MNTSFADLGVPAPIVASLAERGIDAPFPIQALTLADTLAGRDVSGKAPTGSGKTLAFGIPLVVGCPTAEHRRPRRLVLVPTRELATQVADELSKLAGRKGPRVAAFFGGVPIPRNIKALERGVDIAVACPGRLTDLIDQRLVRLDDVDVVVLDEADRMLDIGFRPDIEKILRRCPQSRQTLLLSATIPPPVKRLAERYMHEPEMLDFSPKDVAVETIEQFYFTVDPQRKFDLLVRLIEREQPRQAIVFCRTKRGTDRVGARLARRLNSAAVIHGDLPQQQRDRVMAGFRAGKVRYLVATDVVGRGIDVTSISHIINFDIPEFCDDYVHRVGRTGRMGREGVAYTFVSPEEGNELTRIEMRINRCSNATRLPGSTPSPDRNPPSKPPRPKS